MPEGPDLTPSSFQLAVNPPIPSPTRLRDDDRLPVILVTGLVLFGLLGAISSWLVIPRMEDHLTDEALERLDEAGIAGATITMDGRVATIGGLKGDDAKRAEEILDDEWGIRDARLENVTDPQPVDVPNVTVAPPGTAGSPATTDTTEADDAESDDSLETIPPVEPDLDEELATLEADFNGDGAFTPGSATLTTDAEAILGELAELLVQFPQSTIQIEGHTDDQGDGFENLTLSQARADAVADYLVANGVAPQRLIALGLGENAPIADNATTSGRAENRRTEFFAIP